MKANYTVSEHFYFSNNYRDRTTGVWDAETPEEAEKLIAHRVRQAKRNIGFKIRILLNNKLRYTQNVDLRKKGMGASTGEERRKRLDNKTGHILIMSRKQLKNVHVILHLHIRV